MTYPPELIEAVAAAYTADEIKQQLSTWIIDLASNPDRIVSVNTGGASYSREVRMSISDLIVVWQRALALLTGADDTNPYAQSARPIFTRTF